MNYGAILRACRNRARLSQEELADKLYINQSDISKYENGTKEPSISIVQAWTSSTQTAEVLVAFLMGFEGLGIMQTILEISSTVIGAIM